CDDCLAVCPWNKFAADAHPAYTPREGLPAPLLADLADLDDVRFRQMFSGSPIKRIGRDRFLRNVAIALGNSGRTDALASIAKLIGDGAPLVRGHAIWALSRHVSLAEFLATRKADDNPFCAEEWRLGARDLRGPPQDVAGLSELPVQAVGRAQVRSF
ncbi:MAG: hypothetical protein AAF317_16195, partial [Pseudomonadota bacterium]